MLFSFAYKIRHGILINSKCTIQTEQQQQQQQQEQNNNRKQKKPKQQQQQKQQQKLRTLYSHNHTAHIS